MTVYRTEISLNGQKFSLHSKTTSRIRSVLRARELAKTESFVRVITEKGSLILQIAALEDKNAK
jgi:hypothetical protein